MGTVGIRELRQRASELLRRVQGGEAIEITDRGRPIAVLSALPGGSPLRHLRAVGEVTTSTAHVDDLAEPLGPVPGQPEPTTVLAGLRQAER
ncbi:MAG: type II toxin-antitoxin system Phd/YefM family antitoxin [Candidatus Dormibacteria bacterium]